MENLNPKQQEKLQKLLKLMKEGNLGILRYLSEIEDKVDVVSPNIVEIISKLKGEKGENYVLTSQDKTDILKSLRTLFDDDKLIDEVYGKIIIPYEEIAQRAATFITPPPAEKVDYKRIKKEVLADIVLPTVENGKDADETKIIAIVEENIEKNLPQFGEKFRDGLELLEEEDRLDVSAIKGLKKLIRDEGSSNTTFHGGGGVGSIKQIIAGSNVTVNNTNPQYPIVSSTGGGGGGSLTQIAIAGTINDSNVTFTSATQPDILVINGGLYAQTGGAITWSYSAGTITLSTAVGTGGSIFGLTTSTGATVFPYIPTGTVNGSNTAFTATGNAAKTVVADGITYFVGAGFTNVGLAITMDIAPTGYIRIIQ